jgi:hypothetical protein
MDRRIGKSTAMVSISAMAPTTGTAIGPGARRAHSAFLAAEVGDDRMQRAPTCVDMQLAGLVCPGIANCVLRERSPVPSPVRCSGDFRRARQG